jgi:hypothetical protein
LALSMFLYETSHGLVFQRTSRFFHDMEAP